jgi:hypothetical protein
MPRWEGDVTDEEMLALLCELMAEDMKNPPESQYSIHFVADDVEGARWWVLLENHLLGKFAAEEEAAAAVREFKKGDDESWALMGGERKFQA